MLRSILRALSETDSGYSYSELSRKLSVKMTKLPFYPDQLGKADLVLKTDKGFRIRDRVLRKYFQIELASMARTAYIGFYIYQVLYEKTVSEPTTYFSEEDNSSARGYLASITIQRCCSFPTNILLL